MDWIRAHYDRAPVIAAALLLLLCSLSILQNAAQFGSNFANQVSPPPKPAKPPPKAVELDQATQKLQQAPQWTFSGRSGLFVPEKHFIGANGLPATLKTTQVHPPVPNEWLEEFGLPIADGDVLTQDPDGDGFNNLDEWQGHTNPTDKNSRPDYVAKLTLKSVTQEPFRLKFMSWDGKAFGINALDTNEPTQFLQAGDTVAGTRFKILKFNEKHETSQATGGEIDVSELVLENQDTHDQVTLVLEKVATSPESVATFVYSWPSDAPPREFQVRKDQEFSLKPQEEIKYKLIELQPTKAVIVNPQKPNDRIEIGLLAP
jgi:hypothetical protein